MARVTSAAARSALDRIGAGDYHFSDSTQRDKFTALACTQCRLPVADSFTGLQPQKDARDRYPISKLTPPVMAPVDVSA